MSKLLVTQADSGRCSGIAGGIGSHWCIGESTIRQGDNLTAVLFGHWYGFSTVVGIRGVIGGLRQHLSAWSIAV